MIYSFRHSFHAKLQGGFSLLEVLIAMMLGVLLMAGVITLFSGISSSHRVQSGLARLQENGRFALMRMEADLHMAGAQYCSVTTGASSRNTMIPVLPLRAPMVYAKSLGLPDSNINSINAAGNATNALATVPYILSPRWFMQGYSCTATTCTPALTHADTGIPDMGLTAGSRVPASDVLTVRYQRGTGWAISPDSCSTSPANDIASGTTLDVLVQPGDDNLGNFTIPAGQDGLVFISDCVSPAIFPVSAVNPTGGGAGALGTGSMGRFTIGDILPGATGALCNGNSMRDVRVFNFHEDFVTVSFYLVFRPDENPDAKPNSTAAQRLIPVLVRRINGEEQELVRGVDQLVFNYGVKESDGRTRIMSADAITLMPAAQCSPPPPGIAAEPGCMWRNVRTIEARLLLNTVDEVGLIDNLARSYRFNNSTATSPAETATLPSGLQLGNMHRREFVGHFSVRNGNL